ncbi:efflux RND transporter periplasmic adaptor subunit [Sulfurovum sp. zt1-1]|uniref:Efflux RND transporter periplasmic adaptor subunit n=1 Tax=Sulfurovum zhangzhouensis TaxID=3019067 RepID=A0ABT7R092_9BACT|nr:efflux RND transporter periplasmic adaptor subunit [Sulfurovum zhangzhouensis]MDM5272520.1 efflux RND transporter periplasmic adaptor subunit [Sulfurovum zhangzhouensis]
MYRSLIILIMFTLTFSMQAEELKQTPEKTSEKPREQIQPTVSQLFNVTTVKVKKGSIAPKKTYYGYVVADDALMTDIVAWYSGFVEMLYTNQRYQRVNKGEALAKVYAPEVYKAKQDYLNSLRFGDKHPSPEMIKSARDKLELLGVDPKEIVSIEQTRRVDTMTTIYAPVSGWIVEKHINNGSAFKTMNTLFTIVDLEHVWVEMKLYQDDLENLKELNHFTIKIKGINNTFQAKKSLLYPMINPKESTATLRLTLQNPNDILMPGMYATISAAASQSTQLLIPRTAAIRKNGSWYAFLATEFKGEYEPVKIELKPLDDQYFIVTQGLDEGESIVNNALFMMDSDAQINSLY